MYLGRIVEMAPRDALYDGPMHPYTRLLLAAIPRPEPDGPRIRAAIRGDVPSPMNVPPGCAFHTRCPHVMPRCRSESPHLAEVAPGRAVSCWLHAGA